MIEILPTKQLTETDAPIFGTLAVNLGKLQRAGLSVAPSITVCAPDLKLKTALEHYDFGHKEIFEQSLTLVKKELRSIPVPDVLVKETKEGNRFLFNGYTLNSVKGLWHALLDEWIDEVKNRLWKDGFYKGITENLDSRVVVFIKKVESSGEAYFDVLQDDVIINIKFGKLHPRDMAKIVEIVQSANKKLFFPHQYEWILDGGIKLAGLKPYTPPLHIPDAFTQHTQGTPHRGNGVGKIEVRSTVKVFLDSSEGLVIEKDVDGIYISSEKIFDLNTPRDSFEGLVFKIVETAITFPESPVLVKLADMSEGMGKLRGALRLLHQSSLLEPMIDALDFARHKKNLANVHIVIPFVRSVDELMKVKRELVVKKLSRKNSLQLWMEVATPENIINLEDYLLVGLDGVVLNLDELIAHFNGFDHTQEDLMFYKNEVGGLLKFLEDGLKLLHKAMIPFITYGTLSMYPQVLEFLVEKGVYGIVVERYEAHSITDLLHTTEKKMILSRSLIKK